MICALLLAAAASQPLLVFHGNVALVDGVYLSVLDLPAGTPATPASARLVTLKLRRFLHQAGYVLATVRAQVDGQQIVVDIDEGRLDKIIFLGAGSFETLRLRLELHLQADVFNKPDLERQLKALAQRMGLAEFAYEIVPVAGKPQGSRLEEIEPLEELSMGVIRPGRPYELHILVQPGAFHPGLSPEIEVDSLEGGGVGAVYRTGRILTADDRFRVGGRVAGALREKLDNTGSRFVFTRALGEAAYEAQPIAGFIRPSLLVRADLSNRQRPDLNLESFEFFTLEAGPEVVFLPEPQVRAALGTGVQRRLLFSPEPEAGVPQIMQVMDVAQTREFAEALLQLTFDPDELRLDRHHKLTLGARVYGAPHPGESGALHLLGTYQKMFSLGWDELWIQGRAVSRTGFVLFPEEESVGGDALRGPFSLEYARRLAAVGVEYRFSLLRDVFKLGIFHNAVAFGAIDRRTDAERPAVADSFGLGVHALIIDEFQLDAYFGVGFASAHGPVTSSFDSGAALVLRQAF